MMRLSVVSKASATAAKLGDLASSLVPGQPWQAIRALGNRLRYEYDDIREDRLWDIVQESLESTNIVGLALR